MLDEEVFGPLGMRETSLGVRPDLAQRLCPVRAAYTGQGLIPAEAMEGIGELIRSSDLYACQRFVIGLAARSVP